MKNAFDRYKRPFRANCYWVEDARGEHVAEMRDDALALAMADLLNSKAAQVESSWEVERLRSEGAYDSGRDGWS